MHLQSNCFSIIEKCIWATPLHFWPVFEVIFAVNDNDFLALGLSWAWVVSGLLHSQRFDMMGKKCIHRVSLLHLPQNCSQIIMQ